MKLGIDVGRVLISPGDELSPDTSFIGGSPEDAMRTPPYDGMFEALPGIVERFAGQVWIVSKCGAKVRQRTLDWFAHHRFFERTAIDPSRVFFCRERPQKAGICADLGITHFVDDRLDVLEPMRGIVRWRFLFGPQSVTLPADADVHPVADWPGTARALQSAREG